MDDMTMSPNTRPMPVIESVMDTYGNNELELRTEYLSYDCYGNPVEIRSDKRNNVYLWGYSGKYLIAIIENASEQDVRSALNIESLSEVSVKKTPDNRIGNTLRSSLPNSLVTSYTYLPGVGMSSQTSPDGQTIYYEYDVKGRLSYTYRMDGDRKSIIEKYDYNLVNE